MPRYTEADLVHRFYEAGTDPERFSALLRALCDAFRAEAANCNVLDARLEDANRCFTHAIPEEFVRSYAEYYGERDEWRRGAVTARSPARVFRGKPIRLRAGAGRSPDLVSAERSLACRHPRTNPAGSRAALDTRPCATSSRALEYPPNAAARPLVSLIARAGSGRSPAGSERPLELPRNGSSQGGRGQGYSIELGRAIVVPDRGVPARMRNCSDPPSRLRIVRKRRGEPNAKAAESSRRLQAPAEPATGGGISTKLPMCSFFRNSRWASAMRSRGKVFATRGRISPRSM